MGPLQEKRFDCQTGSTPLCELLQVRPKEVASQTVQVITERDCLALIELHGMSHAGRYKDAGQLQSPASFRQGLKLPLEMGVLSFVQNVDKELRNGGKASTCGIHAGI